MATEKRLIEYYVVRNKSTGFYFRGKGVNRWGEYYNQASIYRVRAHAENTENWLNLRGEPVEIVPIEIKENPTVDAVEVTEFNEILYKLECLLCHATGGKYSKAGYSLEDMERMVTDYIEECCDEAVEEKVVHGRWVLAKPRVKGRNATYRCTACGKLRSSYYNDVFQWEYCPCGAKMDGKE